MKRIIGIVSEGPTDYLVLKTVIDTITGEKNIYRRIQPEQDMCGEYGNGWKGVCRWCESNARFIPELFTGLSPGLDLLIIHMDGDVSRKEKEIHCICKHTSCDDKGTQALFSCERIKTASCPIVLPCPDHDNSPEGYRTHLEDTIRLLLGESSQEPGIVITIPCDSTDAWIVAAYDDKNDVENIEDPWGSIISRRKDYHGIRIHGHKKSISVYKMFLQKLSMKWPSVTEKCTSAQKLEEELLC